MTELAQTGMEKVEPADFLLFHLGWDKRWGTPDGAPLRAVAFWADSVQRKRKRPKIIRKIFFGRQSRPS